MPWYKEYGLSPVLSYLLYEINIYFQKWSYFDFALYDHVV